MQRKCNETTGSSPALPAKQETASNQLQKPLDIREAENAVLPDGAGHCFLSEHGWMGQMSKNPLLTLVNRLYLSGCGNV